MIVIRPTSQVKSDEPLQSFDGEIFYHEVNPPKAMIIQVPFQEVFKTYKDGNKLPHIGIPSWEQRKALSDISCCKTAEGGFSVYQCRNCRHLTYNYNKCKNRNCPVCQNLKSMVWLDNRSAEVIDSDYYHVVMTVPHELNDLIYENQKELYNLLHSCLSRAMLELAADEKYLGGTPGIIQVLHTWDQHLRYHVHVHAIVTGAGLNKKGKIVHHRQSGYLFPHKVVAKLVKEKYLDALKDMYDKGNLNFKGRASKYRNHYEWKELVNTMYDKEWVCNLKETFNGKGNAIEYLARYTNKIAIGNSRIKSVEGGKVTYTSRDEEGKQTIVNELSFNEFVGRYLMHVLPSGFQKIRYYGFLANGCRKKKLEHIFKEQGRRQYLNRYKEPTEQEVLRTEFHVNLDVCPKCGKSRSMKEIDCVRGRLSHTYIPFGRKMTWLRNFLAGGQ